jgi:hypothetical protein
MMLKIRSIEGPHVLGQHILNRVHLVFDKGRKGEHVGKGLAGNTSEDFLPTPCHSHLCRMDGMPAEQNQMYGVKIGCRSTDVPADRHYKGCKRQRNSLV